jgi:hypothetical protein
MERRTVLWDESGRVARNSSKNYQKLPKWSVGEGRGRVKRSVEVRLKAGLVEAQTLVR